MKENPISPRKPVRWVKSAWRWLAGGVALLLSAAGVEAQQTDFYTNQGTGFPYWDNANLTAWSLFAAPTAGQTAVFVASPVPISNFALAVGIASVLNPDAREIVVSDSGAALGLGGTSPIAYNLIFLGSYQLVSTVVPVGIYGTIPPSFLTLTGGEVTVTNSNVVVLDTNVNVLSGQLTKLGPGTLEIGPGRVITGNVQVAQGTFGGTGAGPFGITGNFNLANKTTLSIGVSSPTAYDELVIGGSARIHGTLDVRLLNGFVPKAGEKFTILDAAEVSGQFSNVDAPEWGLLTLRPIYGDRTITLKAVIASFDALPGLTANQHAVAQDLDKVIYDPRAAGVLDFLYNRDLNDLPKQYDRISPEALTSIFTMGVALEQAQSLNLQRRTEDIRSGSSGFSAANLAMNGDNPFYSGSFGLNTGVAGPSGNAGKEVKETKEVAPPEQRWGAFLSGTGEWVSVGDTDNARGYDLASGGFTLGVDYKVCPNFAIGLAAGYTGTTADLTDHGRVWMNGGRLGIYATTFVGGWYADVAGFGGYNSYDTRRGGLQGEARGDTDGGEVDGLFGTGYDFKVGALTFGPTATFNYTYVGLNGFTESGSLAPLNIHGANENSYRSAFGLKASYECKCGGLVFKPEVRAAWQHEYGTTAYALDSSFADGAGSTFTVSGPKLGRDSCLLGAGFAVQVNDRCATYFYYDGELGRTNYQSTAVTGGVRVSF